MRAAAPFLLPILLIFGFGFGLLAVGTGFRRGVPGLRLRGIAFVPFAIGIVLIVTQIGRFTGESGALLGKAAGGGLVAGSWWGIDAVWSLPIGIGSFTVGILAAELFVVVLPGYAGGLLRGSLAVTEVTRSLLGFGMAAVVVLSAIGVEALAVSANESGLRISATFSLPGTPTSVVATGPHTGYIAFAEGEIARFELPSDTADAATFTTVATGLTYPRGLAVVGDNLFAIGLGPLPCDPPYPQCAASNPDDEVSLIDQSSARVLRYPIDADGGLGDPTTILDGIPVVNTEHAPGSITPGDDGYLYLTIGNVDTIAPTPGRVADVQQPHADWLGTLARFRTDGSDFEIVVHGLRNVYEVAVDADGRMYGVDNGGVTQRGYRGEEVTWLRFGLDHGFPTYGTFSRDRDPATSPLTLLPNGGSAGIAWAPDIGLGPGLLVGGLGTIIEIPLQVDATGPFVPVEHPIRTLLSGINGFVPSLEPTGDGRLLCAVFGAYAGGNNRLLVLEPS